MPGDSMPVLDSLGIAWNEDTTPGYKSKPFWAHECPKDYKYIPCIQDLPHTDICAPYAFTFLLVFDDIFQCLSISYQPESCYVSHLLMDLQ